MSSFRTAGALDDAQIVMGDRGFLRLSQRLEPSQLVAGDVSMSLNGRMDRGAWQPRRGIRNLGGALQVTGAPLRLPFWLVDTPGGIPILDAQRVGSYVILTVASHPFPIGLDPAWLTVEGLTGEVDPNGARLVAVPDGSNLVFEIEGATGSETYGGSGVVRSVIDDTAAARIFGSCVFSDPSGENAESVVIAASGVAYLVAVSDGSVLEIPYPAAATISGPVHLLQAFDRVFLHRQGEQSWEWFGAKGRAVDSAVLASDVVTVRLKDHGLTAGDTVELTGITFVTTDPNGMHVVVSTPTSDTFTFALVGPDETFTAQTGDAVAGFTKVRSGDLVQPQVFEATGADVDVANGLCTLTVTGNTTVLAGDDIRLYDATWLPAVQFIGRTLKVIEASATEISFYLAVPDTADISSDTITVGKAVSIGAGLRNMPAPPWSVYHQRRLCCPYWYSQTGTTASPVFTDREIRDEIVISDILDPYTYDTIENQFRITAGIDDFVVAMWPFYEDRLLVFNRRSIHMVTGVSGSLADTTTKELTREIGCLSRKSIAQHGAEILFLSDNGVYSVAFLDEYNLRGVDIPLSDAIQPVIERVNASLAGDSVGIYFNNRYYLALPLDSSPGAGDATGNNGVIIFNFLNQGWESVDSVADSRWNVLNFHIARAGERNNLYAVNTLGGLHLLDEADSALDEVAVSPGDAVSSSPVVSGLETRQYTGDSLDRKRFTEVQVQIESSGIPSDADFAAIMEDPDAEVPLTGLSAALGGPMPAGEEASVRPRIGGSRGHGCIVRVTPTGGRPKVKSIRVTGTAANRSATTQK